MKNGIIRRVDALGRVVIPKEMRISLGIQHDALLNISIERGGLFISKTEYENCTICGQVVEKSDTYCRNCGKKL